MSGLVFPEAILEQHLVVLGKTGAGKSSALRHIVEHLLRHKKRVCVIDPKGDWNGLKVSADGNGAGFPVILFGNFKETAGHPIHADVPLNEYSGKHIAELVTSGNRPCVVGFRGWTMGNMHKFWIDFAATIFGSNEGEFYLVIDEVHNFAPKGKIQSPEVGMCLHWANRIMNEGRGIGLVNLIASQRPQKVHNDTLTACETLVAMRVIHKADRDAVEDWIKGCGDPKQGAEVLNTLAGMKRGEAYVWSPEAEFGPERITFPMFKTFDSFAPPQLQKKVRGKDWASVDLDVVKHKLAAVIEKAKAEDPRELNKIIADLKKNAGPREQDTKRIQELTEQLAKAKATPSGKPKVIEKKIIVDKNLTRLEKLVESLSESGTSLVERISTALSDETVAVQRLLTEAKALNAQELVVAQPVEEYVPPTVQPVALRKPVVTAQPPASANNGNISGVMQKVLDSLAEFEAIGVERVPRVQVAFMSGYSHLLSKSFANAMGALRTGGYVGYPDSDSVAFTQLGRAAAHMVSAPLSTEEMQKRILDLLGGVHAKIIQNLIPVYPDSVEKSALAADCGYSHVLSKSFANALGRLRTLGFIGYPQTGYVVATPMLFPKG